MQTFIYLAAGMQRIYIVRNVGYDQIHKQTNSTARQ